MHPVRFTIEARDGHARTGTASAARGDYRTPCFMPVGTRGAVKHLSSADYASVGAQIVLGNTYHLMLRPGADLIEEMGGLGRFTAWDGLTLTDSGGFQIFSLSPRIDDDGVTFVSTYDGSKHRLGPEDAVRIQEKIGADIQMVLDVCPALPAEHAVVESAVVRTSKWAAVARASHRRQGQSLFGIVQGGIDEGLRRRSAIATVELDFDGYGIGGLSVGESRAEMLPALAAAIAELPEDRPRYLMGVGDPASLVEAVGLGVDQFDCVLQTRLGRHGTALTTNGKLQVKNAAHARSDEPMDPGCSCSVCAVHSRAYLRHLFQTGEPTGSRLVSLHNLSWTAQLMSQCATAISEGRFEALRRRVVEVWG